MPRQPLFQLPPAACLPEVLTCDVAHPLLERDLPRSLPLPELPGGDLLRAIRRRLPLELIVVARDLAKAERPLLLPKRRLDLPVVLLRIPGAEGLRVDPVDHQVDMPVPGVAMGYDEDLVVLEPEIAEETVGHRAHLRRIDGIGGIEGEGDMIDRSLRPVRLRSGRPHEQPRRPGIGGRKVARLDPLHALLRVPVLPRLQVAGQAAEPAAPHHLRDHPILRTAARTSSNAERISSRAVASPISSALRAS